jgi:hypothetical protein
MLRRVRMFIAAVLVVFALLGTTWVASSVPSVMADGPPMPGENGGGGGGGG